MTKEEYLEIASRHWDSIDSLKEKENFYDYEAILEGIMVSLGRDVSEKSLGTIPSERRKKKKETRFGRIEIAGSHFFYSQGDSMYSPYLQDLCLFVG